MGGVAKGAFSEEEAEKKFEAWMAEKQDKIDVKVKGLAKAKSDKKAKIFEAEKTINENRMASAKAAANEAIKAEADAKAAKEAAANAANEVEEAKPETIEDAAAAAADEKA